jgi:amidase
MFTEYENYDALGLAALVAKGDVTPAELWETALAKITAGEPRLNTMLEVFANPPALVPGPFAGVPFILKDIYQKYAGARSTSGTRALHDYRASTTDTVVQRFLAAGLAPIGTSNVPELALKATTEAAANGPTRNPWDTARTPGGSSGGSAAAVAAGYVPMAGASDGGGSIRIPASYCGLFGMKVSRGRVPAGPDYGDIWEGASVSGVLTRSVRDAATMLDAISGPDVGAPFHIAPPARPFAQEVGAKVERLRIGFSTASPIGGRVEAEMVAAVHNAARLLESLGHVVEEAAPAVDGTALLRCYFALYYGQINAAMRRICAQTGAKPSSFATDTRVAGMCGSVLTAGEYVSQHLLWNQFARAVGAFHETYDVYLTPTVAMQASRIGEMDMPPWRDMVSRALLALGAGGLIYRAGIAENVGFESVERTPFTQLANLTFCPAMSVPLHWGADGMPVGVQFSAAFGGEGLLFRLAAQLEEAQNWAHRRAIF